MLILLDMVRTLISDYNVDINSGVEPPIISAVFLEEDDIFLELIQKGATLDGEVGIKAVQAARSADSQSMLALLKKHGVNIDTTPEAMPAVESHRSNRYFQYGFSWLAEVRLVAART